MSPGTVRLTVGLALLGCAPADDVDTPPAPAAATDAAAAPSPAAPAGPRDVSPTDAPGPFGAGVTTFEHRDPDGRTFKVEVWYPARVPAGAEPDAYEEIPLALNAHRDAAAATDAGPFPLLAFSHGLGGIRYQSAFLTEHLATHGFVVVAPDHPGTILLDVLAGDALTETILRRPSDVRAAVDDLIDRSEAGDPVLGGLVQGEDYALLGHSLGAVTTLMVAGGAIDAEALVALCEAEDRRVCSFLGDLDPADVDTTAFADPRVRAAVALSPGGAYVYGPDGAGLRALPATMVWGGQKDTILDYTDEIAPVYAALDAPRYFGTFADAGHYLAFSDLCRVLPFFPDCGGEPEGFLDQETGHAVVATLTTAFLFVHHAGDDRYRPWLDVAVLPEAQRSRVVLDVDAP